VGTRKGEKMTATMSNMRLNDAVSKNTSSNWTSFYKLGGTAALLSVLVVLTDIALTFFPASRTAWHNDRRRLVPVISRQLVFGLRNLGLLPNILNLSLSIPIFLGSTKLTSTNKAYAAFALILSLVGTAIYLSNNAAFPMLAERQVSSCHNRCPKSTLTAAGEAILAAEKTLRCIYGFFSVKLQ
jgi:hypothetical protein